MSIGLERKPKGSGQTEVSEFDDSSSRINEQVLGFQISVENSVCVQIDQRLEDLVEQTLNLMSGQSRALRLQILFQIVLQVFEH